MKIDFKGLCLIAAFAFASAGLSAADSLGRYEGNRVGADANEPKTFMETCAWTYTEPGKMDIQITFCKDDESEVKKGGPDVHQFAINLSRADYEKIFESSTPVKEMVIEDVIWNRKISTEITGSRRVVKIAFTNTLDKEITSVFKRGTLEMVLESGEIASLKMTKEKKRFLNMGGFATSFTGEARAMKRVKKGLALLDEGEMGRLVKTENIDKALANKTTKGFREAIQLEK